MSENLLTAELEQTLYERVMTLTAELKDISNLKASDFGQDLILGRWKNLKAKAEELHSIANSLAVLVSVSEPVIREEQLFDLLTEAILAGDEVEYMGAKGGAFGGMWEIDLSEGDLRLSGEKIFQVKFGSSWMNIPTSLDAAKFQKFKIRKNDGSEQHYALNDKLWYRVL